MVPRGGLQHEAAFGQLQLSPQVVVFGSDFGDPLLTVLQKLQLGAEACGPLKAETQPFSLFFIYSKIFKTQLKLSKFNLLSPFNTVCEYFVGFNEKQHPPLSCSSYKHHVRAEMGGAWQSFGGGGEGGSINPYLQFLKSGVLPPFCSACSTSLFPAAALTQFTPCGH